MSLSLSNDAVTKLLSGYFAKMTPDEKTLFLSKLIEDKGTSLEKLLEFVKSPKTFRYIETIDGKELSIGDTVYIDANHLWGSAIDKGIKNNTIIDGQIRPATIVDFEFFPEMKVIVNFHSDGHLKENTSISNHYLTVLNLV